MVGLRLITAVLPAALVLIAGSAAGAATAQPRFTFRIYDPTGHVSIQVTTADVVRSSAVADPPPSGGGTAGLTLAFTKIGATKFHALTHALALRGARLHRAQVTAIAINGHIYGRPAIDYEAFPNGLSGRDGIEVTGMTFTVAKRLARLIRSS